jgi:hypothetical protein
MQSENRLSIMASHFDLMTCENIETLSLQLVAIAEVQQNDVIDN